MKLKITDIGANGTDILFSEKITIDGETGQEIPVEAELHVFRDGASVFVTGSIKAVIDVECSRCLEKFASVIDSNLNITCLLSERAEKIEEKKELAEEELDVSYYEGDDIDLSNLMREQVALNIPFKLLCSDECKGLCPYCGANLNKTPCDCKREMIDERWIKLKKLINERKD